VRRNTAVAGAALIALAVTPVAISQAGAAQKPVTKTIKVRDNYFSPDRLSVPKGSRVQWKWPSFGGDVHDVKLRKGPKGVKRFHSALASSDYKYPKRPKRLTVPGRYLLVCTMHTGMEMTIRVRR
jgi:plastocyanin